MHSDVSKYLAEGRRAFFPSDPDYSELEIYRKLEYEGAPTCEAAALEIRREKNRLEGFERRKRRKFLEYSLDNSEDEQLPVPIPRSGPVGGRNWQPGLPGLARRVAEEAATRTIAVIPPNSRHLAHHSSRAVPVISQSRPRINLQTSHQNHSIPRQARHRRVSRPLPTQGISHEFLASHRNQRQPEQISNVALNHFGSVIGEDEAGPIYDYSHLSQPIVEDSSLVPYKSDRRQRNTLEQINRASMDNLPAGVAARLQQLEDNSDDEVDHSVPSTWGVDHTPKYFQTENLRKRPSSSNPNIDDVRPEPSRTFARAFIPRKEYEDPCRPQGQNRSFQFSTPIADAPLRSSWDTMDFRAPMRQISWLNGHRSSRQSPTSSNSDHISHAVNDVRNQALEGIFNSGSVRRVTDEHGGDQVHSTTPTMSSEINDLSTDNSYKDEIDPLLEDTSLDIDSNIRANFVPISELESAPRKRTAFELRNHEVVSSNKNAPISTVIAGELVTYTPKPADERLRRLDRHGKYIGENLGDISKRAIRQRKRDIENRDKEMLQATAGYRVLAAMDVKDRAKLLERLRKPFIFHGAFEEDQEDMEEIPEVYIREISSDRIFNWLGNESVGHTTITQTLIAARNSVLPSEISESSVDGSEQFDNLGDHDEFLAGHSYVPLERPKQNKITPKYLQDALFYGSKNTRGFQLPQIPLSTLTTSTLDRPDEISKFLPSPGSGSTTRAQIRRLGALQSDSDATPSSWSISSRGIDDPFTFDDSPEFQIPADVDIESTTSLTVQQDRLYQLASHISNKHGRVVLVRLHEPVKFSPGAVAQRVFGGIIQEMQLFPTQRIAIVVFLHSTEAKAFIRHVKKTYEIGSAHEIRQLQIEAGWYKDSERESIIPRQSNILTHHISSQATRCLLLHRIPLQKTVAQVSLELGNRLSKPLLKVILCTPQQRYKQERFGRQAIVEFAGIKDAIEAREALMEGLIDMYENCEPDFAADPSVRLETERSWCKCLGCAEQRSATK